MFGDKIVSDSLLNAVMGVTSKEQIDSSGASLSVGDNVRVQEGPHSGSIGTITGFKNSGTSDIQLDRGPHVSLYNEMLLNEELTASEADAMRLLIKNRQRIADAKQEAEAAAKKKKKPSYDASEADEEYTPDHGDPFVEASMQYLKTTLGERKQKKTEFDDPDPKELEKKFKDNGDQTLKSDKKKKLGNGEELEINPEARMEEKRPNNIEIISLIKRAVREQREKGYDASDAIEQTPGQEAPQDALDYEKYNGENPIVPNDEVDAMLEKGSQFYKD